MNINNYLQTGVSVNVTADAGTGKTWFIIAKILRMLLDDVSPEKITAITFTKKSSVEMRERLNAKMELWGKLSDAEIRKELNSIGINKRLDFYKKKARNLFIKTQISNKDIRIATFDAFFMDILSQFHLDKEVSKKIETNTNLNSKLIAKEVEDKILSSSNLKKNVDLQKNIDFLIEQIGSFNSVKESINGIIDKKSYYLEIYENIYNVKNNTKEKENRIKVFKQTLIDNIENKITKNNLENLFYDLKSYLSSNDFNNDNKINLIKDTFITKSRTPRKNIEKKLVKENFKIDIMTDEIYKYEEKIFYEIQNSWKFLVNNFFLEYQNVLNKENIYDFSDKTWLCYKKLSELVADDWLLYKISNSISHILIDEFQDTNFLQWQIIKIILNAINDKSDSSTVTIVGDPKQSIYGFRGSEPKLFDICKKFTSLNFQSKDFFLNESRRSSKKIVNFINKVFPENKDFFTKIKKDGVVDIHELVENNNEGLRSNISQLITAESNRISEQVHDLVENYKIDYKSIMILVRNRTHAKEIEKILINSSIPVTSNFKKSLLDEPEINHLYLLLKYLILEENNITEIYSLLTSPIFNYTINDLNKYNVYDYSQLNSLIYNHGIGPLIKKWKNLIGLVPMHDLLNIIYKDLDIIKTYFTNNEVRNSEINYNFLNFLNLSLKINNGRYVTPLQFLCKIEKTRDFAESNEPPDLNCVKILTIHSAKGLESEVVILAQSYRNNIKYDKILPIFSKDFACKDLLYNPKIFKNNIFIDSKFENTELRYLSEDRNLLYVACTRAKNVLIINGYKTKDSWFSNSLFSQ